MGVEHLIITLSQRKRNTCIIAVRALKCEFRICRQSCRCVVCLNNVSHRDRYFERSDIPLGRLTPGIIAIVCCLDGQRTGAYIVGAAAAGNGEILVLFQLFAVVCHDKIRHTGVGPRIEYRFIAIGERDLGIAEIRLGDDQLFVTAHHRIAVLGGSEINIVGSDCASVQVYDIVPVGANLFIFRFLLAIAICGIVVSIAFPDVDGYIRVLRIAAGAELDGRAPLHLRRVAGQVLAIDLQIQGLGGDGQAIDDNVLQLRAFDIIRGVPLVSAIRARDLEAKAGGLLQDVLPLCGIGQCQFTDHSGMSRSAKFRTSESNDLTNAGYGGVLRIAQGGGDIVTLDALDRHRALDAVAVQIKSRVLCAADGIIAGHVGQQRKGCATVSVCVKGRLQISKSPPRAVALAIVQGCFSHRGRVAVGTVGAIKAVLAAVAAQLYHQVAALGSGFLQRKLCVAIVVSQSRLPGKQITQCDAVIQPQTVSQNLSAVQPDCAAPNLQLEQSGIVILRIKYQCTAVPHGHAHRAVAAAAVNDRQVAGANLARGRKAAHIQAVSAQTVSVQIQREGLADIYAVRQHPVCQQLDGLTVSCRIQGGLHIGIIGFADASRELCPADRALAVFVDGACAVCILVGAGKAAGALVVHHGVDVFLDGYVGQLLCIAVLHVVALVESVHLLRIQQGHERLQLFCDAALNAFERAAADGDGSVMRELHLAKRAVRNFQRSAGTDNPFTRVIGAAIDGDGSTL